MLESRIIENESQLYRYCTHLFRLYKIQSDHTVPSQTVIGFQVLGIYCTISFLLCSFSAHQQCSVQFYLHISEHLAPAMIALHLTFRHLLFQRRCLRLPLGCSL
jgi:hypothetical protein